MDCQRKTRESLPPDAMVDPFLGEKATAVTGFSWPRRSKTGRASSRSNILMLPSREDEARKFPLGWKDT